MPEIDRLEREIQTKFDAFNRQVELRLSQFVTADGINDQQLLNSYRELVEDFSIELANVYLMGGLIAADRISEMLGRPVSFDPTETTALAAINRLKNRVIIGLQQQQAEALAEMRRQFANTIPIRSPQEVIRGLNLTARQNVAVANYRRLLEEGSAQALSRELRDRRFDPTVLAAVRGDKPLTEDQIERMVGRYQERQLRSRSKTIAATEAVKIANSSDHTFFQQLILRQQIREDQLKRTWVTSKDSKVRDSHDHLDGKTTEFNEPWVSGNGNLLMFPGDPAAPAEDVINCRCWVRTDIKEEKVACLRLKCA